NVYLNERHGDRLSEAGGTMPRSYGFFDSCSYHPETGNSCMVLGENMGRVRKGVRRILDAADRLKAPILATSCLGILRGDDALSLPKAVSAMNALSSEKGPPGFRGGTAFVPMSATESEVEHALRCQRILFERTSCKSGDENVQLRTFDVFGVNRH